MNKEKFQRTGNMQMLFQHKKVRICKKSTFALVKTFLYTLSKQAARGLDIILGWQWKHIWMGPQPPWSVGRCRGSQGEASNTVWHLDSIKACAAHWRRANTFCCDCRWQGGCKTSTTFYLSWIWWTFWIYSCKVYIKTTSNIIANQPFTLPTTAPITTVIPVQYTYFRDFIYLFFFYKFW